MDDTSSIMELNDKNFMETIKNNEKVMVLFYSPTCIHSIHTQPIYEELSIRNKNNIKYTKLDGTLYPIILQNYQINSYPTLMLFMNEKEPVVYQSTRNVNEIEEWISMHIRPIPQQLTFSGILTELTDEMMNDVTKEPTFVLFYTVRCGHCVYLKPVYNELVNTSTLNVKFGQIDCGKYPQVIKDYNLRGFPTMLLFVENQIHEYKGPRQVSSMNDWIKNKL